jgi:integrase
MVRVGEKLLGQHVFVKEFVIHSARHTCLIRPGEAGADAFTIMKLMGHSSKGL